MQFSIRLIKKGAPVKWIDYGGADITVEGCPLSNPPKEIVEKGNEAILRYWQNKDIPALIHK